MITINSGPSIARSSLLWMGLLQLSLWSCQLLASLDNSFTQCGSVCPVRVLVIKRFGIEQNLLFLLPLRKFLNKTYLLAPISSWMSQDWVMETIDVCFDYIFSFYRWFPYIVSWYMLLGIPLYVYQFLSEKPLLS